MILDTNGYVVVLQGKYLSPVKQPVTRRQSWANKD